jgi:hypothetical protein
MPQAVWSPITMIFLRFFLETFTGLSLTDKSTGITPRIDIPKDKNKVSHLRNELQPLSSSFLFPSEAIQETWHHDRRPSGRDETGRR